MAYESVRPSGFRSWHIEAVDWDILPEVISDYNPKLIAEVHYPCGGGYEMAKANALLMASAPDLLREHNAMLEACLFTANVMEGILLYDTLEDATEELCEVRERVEEALALVRGEDE